MRLISSAAHHASVPAQDRIVPWTEKWPLLPTLAVVSTRELELLQHVYSAAGKPSGRVLIPPGDDLAMVSVGESRLLAGIDQLVAGLHVNLQVTPIELVGRKAVTRSLSDVAAMAARPVASLAAVTLPSEFGHSHAAALFDAMRETADQYRCPLVGGDIAVHRDPVSPLICTVAVLAEPGPTAPVGRGGAQAGDEVYVTGALGGSFGGDGLGRHLTFEPRLAEALQLAESLGERLHAMIDISDGLGRDASHLADRSTVQVQIDADHIPCHEGLDWRRAMSDGEDYELCFIATGDVPTHLGNLIVTAVGKVVARTAPNDPLVLVHDGSHMIDGSQLGWEHCS